MMQKYSIIVVVGALGIGFSTANGQPYATVPPSRQVGTPPSGGGSLPHHALYRPPAEHASQDAPSSGPSYAGGPLGLSLDPGSELPRPSYAPPADRSTFPEGPATQPGDGLFPQPPTQQSAPSPGPPNESAANRGPVVDILVRGNRQVTLQEVLRHVKTSVGRPYDQNVVTEDVRRLNATGLFVNIRPSVQNTPAGCVVIFDVIERRIAYYVKYTGNKAIAKKHLAEQAAIEPGDPLMPYAIDEARRKMLEHYRAKGFPNAHITVLEGYEPGDRGIIFLIDEGVRQRVRWIEFVGNTIAFDERLKTQIQTKHGLLSYFHGGLFPTLMGGELDHEKLDLDVRRLEEYYRSLGYFRCRIGREIVPLHNLWDSRNPAARAYNVDQGVKIVFVIDEGPRYRIRDLKIVGNNTIATEALRKDMKLRANDYYNQNTLLLDRGSIVEKYGAIGYIFADIQAEPRLSEEPGWLDLVYQIDEGRQCRVGKINVDIRSDDPYTRINTVLNRMSIKPGDIVNLQELRESERRLRASGLFETNPAVGEPPQIAFTKPKEADQPESSVANRPGEQPPGFRGQSPDAGSWDDRGPWTVDLIVRGTLLPEASEKTQPANGSPGAVPPPSIPFSALQPRQSPPPFREDVWRRASVETVVRGQVAVPSLPSQTVRPSVTEPPYSMQPYSPPASSPFALSPPPGSSGYVPPTADYADPWSRGSQTAAPTGATHVHPGQTAVPTSPTVAAPASPAYGGLTAYGGTASYPAHSLPPAGVAPYTAGQAPIADPFVSATASPAYGAPLVGSAPGEAIAAPGSSYDQLRPSPAWGSGLQTGPVTPYTPPRDYLGPTMLVPGDAAAQDPSVLYGRVPSRDPLLAVPLFPTVAETTTGQFMLSVGVNSDAGLMGNVLLVERNFDIMRWPESLNWYDLRNAFRGGGQMFRVEASPGTHVQRYTISWSDPYIFDTEFSFGVSGFYYTRFYQEWDEQRLGGRVTVGRQWTKDFITSFIFRAEQVDLYNPTTPTPPTIAEAVGESSLFGFRLEAVYDKRDHPFMPTQGFLVTGGVEQVIGTYQYPRADVDLRRYFTLYRRPDYSGAHVLGVRGLVEATGRDTPVYEHIFYGGSQTIRGFEFRKASPREDGVVVGGEFGMLGSVEYMFPLTQTDQLRGVVFCDAGTVQPTISNWDNKFRVAPGFGLRIAVPFMGQAPIALDFAFPVSLEPNDQVNNFSFFVGFLR